LLSFDLFHAKATHEKKKPRQYPLLHTVAYRSKGSALVKIS
jgi:hypothetical protein